MKRFVAASAACILLSAAFQAHAEGIEWRHVGAGMGGNSNWLVFDPNDADTLFFAPDVGGLYRSKDGAKSWTKLATKFMHENRGNSVSIIEVAPSDSRRVYAVSSFRFCDFKEPQDKELAARHGTTETGMMRSCDGGDTWEVLYGSPLRPGAIAVDPEDPDTIWAACPGYHTTSLYGFKETHDRKRGLGYVACSTDGGRTWTHTYVGCANPSEGRARKVCFSGIVVDKTSPLGRRTLYVSGFGGVWKSVDHGKTWTSASNGLKSTSVAAIAACYAGDGVLSLYAAASRRPLLTEIPEETAKGNIAGIYRSDDGGANWRDITGNLGHRVERFRITVDPSDKNTIYTAQVRFTDLGGQGYAVWKTSDGGANWRKVMKPGRRGEKENLTREVWNLRYSYIASPDTKICLAPGNSRRIVFADAGCIMWESLDGGETWKTISSRKVGENRFTTRGMDSSYVQVSASPLNEDFILVSCHDFDLLSSTDGGKTFFSGGQTGIIDASGSTGGTFGFLAVAHDPRNPLIAYGGSKGRGGNDTRQGGCFVTTTDGGRTWHAPDANPAGIEQGKLEDILSPETMAKLKPISARSKFLTLNGKSVLHNWCIRDIAIAKSGRIFVSKRTGIYYSDDKGGNWKRSSFEKIGLECDWCANYVRQCPVSGKMYAVVSLMPLYSGDSAYSGISPHYIKDIPETPNALAGLYVSDDGGASFRKSGRPGKEMLLPVQLEISPDGSIYMGTATAKTGESKYVPGGIFRTKDGGNTWERILSCRSARVEGNITGIVVNPKKPEVVYAAVHEPAGIAPIAAIMRSRDGGTTWEDVSGDAAHRAYCSLGLSGPDFCTVLVGTAGAGAFIGRDRDVAASCP